MNLLMVGVQHGKGSYEMRGQQLGVALGARVTTQPTAQDWHWADRVVLVKRAGAVWAAKAHAANVPIVWDALDFWRQPADNQTQETRAFQLLIAQVRTINPALVIAATKAMSQCGAGVYLPHHSWAGLEPTPARERVQVVAYQGGEVYLGQWHQRIAQACAARGWAFVVNPPDLSTADLVVAFRDGPWDGWICREWKSGVKVVNAIAAGRPFISQASAAVRELQPPGSIVETEADLDAAFEAWTSQEAREAASALCHQLAPALRLGPIAARYTALLRSVGTVCAA